MTITVNDIQNTPRNFTFNLVKSVKPGESVTNEMVRHSMKETSVEDYDSEDVFAITHFFNGLVGLPTSASGINRNFYGFGLDLRNAPATEESFDELAHLNDVQMGDNRSFFLGVINSLKQ